MFGEFSNKRGTIAARSRSYVAALFAALMMGLLVCGSVQAAGKRPPFPKLTGTVVDQAGLLSPAAREKLSRELLGYARANKTQLVVVTLKTLNGYPLAEYGYQLGRHWGIGQKGKNNGALLLVDYGEHKMRIEVGYGLEGTLTDALSDNIIRNVIKPHFESGDYQAGIVAGAHAILKVLGGTYKPVREHGHRRRHSWAGLLMLLPFAFGLFPLFFGGFGRRGRWRRGYRGGYWPGVFWGGFGGFGGFGGGIGGGGFGGGGGGFSGGGGSFGGGGASGGW